MESTRVPECSCARAGDPECLASTSVPLIPLGTAAGTPEPPPDPPVVRPVEVRIRSGTEEFTSAPAPDSNSTREALPTDPSDDNSARP